MARVQLAIGAILRSAWVPGFKSLPLQFTGKLSVLNLLGRLLPHM